MAHNPEASMSVDELKKLLKLKRWSRTKLAQFLGQDKSQVSRWFAGETHPTAAARKLMRLALLGKVDFDTVSSL